MSTFSPLLCVAAGLLVAVSPTQRSARLAAQPPDDPMRGPAVSDQAVRTLVQRDMSGKLVRVEGRPEAAAVMQLSLDADQREKAREIVGERAAAIRKLLIEQIDVAKEATEAFINGDRGASEKLAHQLYDELEKSHDRDPMLAALEAGLSSADVAEVKRMVDEYWDAWISSETRGKQTRDEVEKRLEFSLFQDEVRAAYDGTLRPYKDRLDRIERIAEPTPEQKTQIRTAVVDYIRESKLKPTPEQRTELARKVYGALDDERRMKLFEAALFQ